MSSLGIQSSDATTVFAESVAEFFLLGCFDSVPIVKSHLGCFDMSV